MAERDQNWLERLGSRLTENIWNADEKAVERALSRGNNGNLPPLTPEQAEQMKAYLRDPVKWRREMDDKRDQFRESVKEFDREKREIERKMESIANELRQEFSKYALESGLQMSWRGGWYDPETGIRYNDFGDRID